MRTYTYKGAGPVYYDMVYTSNARGQSEKTCFIDADDSTTRATSRYYTWRDRVRRITHPDGNSLDYMWDDHMRMTAEKLDGDTEKYEYDYCLCGALKRQRYIYTDSLANSQTMDWTWTTDKLGRAKKLYHPYEIAKDGDDKYFSLLWEYDKAGRRTVYSDPTYGHTCADTSGWTNHTEPSDETDWVFGEPERYLYGETGGLSAMGRVAGAEVRAGDGEPYFVKRDAAGRIASVIYPNKSDTEKPEYEYRYEYFGDGRLKQTALVSMTNADTGQYGPEKYVVQYFYDDAGRLVKKVVRNNEFSEATQYETSYEFDGMGRMVREKIGAYDASSQMMKTLQDKRTTYDLGGNAIEVKFYDNSGWAFTETRSYARGYQLTGFTTSHAGGVVLVSGGSYTYDTNNNMTGTKYLNVTRGAQLEFRAQWTFTYDRKNRLKSFTNTNASNVRGNLWYDGQGRVWQRWNDNSNTSVWAGTLKRFVYNGALAQEHEFAVGALMGSWVYTYDELTHDYLRQPAGIRQRERSGGSDTDYYMLLDGARLEGKAEREAASSALASREERSASLNQISGRTFENISNLATTSNFVEMYGGGTSGTTAGFDGLVQRGGRHYLAGVDRFTSRFRNQPYTGGLVTSSSNPSGGIPGDFPNTDPILPNPTPVFPWTPPTAPIKPSGGWSLWDWLFPVDDPDFSWPWEIGNLLDEDVGGPENNLNHQLCYTTIDIDNIPSGATNREIILPCAWPPCEHYRDWPFYEDTISILHVEHCTVWGTTPRCCPNNDCPDEAEILVAPNGTRRVVIQSNVQVGDWVYSAVALCDDPYYFTVTNAAGLIPYNIWKAGRDLLLKFVHDMGENPCPTVSANGIRNSIEFHGHRGNLFMTYGCIPCNCSGASLHI